MPGLSLKEKIIEIIRDSRTAYVKHKASLPTTDEEVAQEILEELNNDTRSESNM